MVQNESDEKEGSEEHIACFISLRNFKGLRSGVENLVEEWTSCSAMWSL